MRAMAIAELLPSPPATRTRLAAVPRLPDEVATSSPHDEESELLVEQVETTRNMLTISWRLAFHCAVAAQDVEAWGVEEAAWMAVRNAADTRRLAVELAERRLAEHRAHAREDSFSALAAVQNPFRR